MFLNRWTELYPVLIYTKRILQVPATTTTTTFALPFHNVLQEFENLHHQQQKSIMHFRTSLAKTISKEKPQKVFTSFGSLRDHTAFVSLTTLDTSMASPCFFLTTAWWDQNSSHHTIELQKWQNILTREDTHFPHIQKIPTSNASSSVWSSPM